MWNQTFVKHQLGFVLDFPLRISFLFSYRNINWMSNAWQFFYSSLCWSWQVIVSWIAKLEAATMPRPWQLISISNVKSQFNAMYLTDFGNHSILKLITFFLEFFYNSRSKSLMQWEGPQTSSRQGLTTKFWKHNFIHFARRPLGATRFLN